MHSKQIRRKQYCKGSEVIPKGLLFTFGELTVCLKRVTREILGGRKSMYIYTHEKYSKQKVTFAHDELYYQQLHCTHIRVVLHESYKTKQKFERFALPCRWLTAINGNFIARIYGVSRVENGLRTIIWMRMKFHVFRGGGREEMSTDIDCTSEIRCDPRQSTPTRAFRACRVIYNFHEIFTRRSWMPAKPRYSRNFANLATLWTRLKNHSFSFYRASEFSRLIKCKREARISPHCSQLKYVCR